MKQKKPLTNEQFIVSLLSSNVVGPLAQLVVCTAIDNYTKSVAKLTPTELKKAFPDNGIICGNSWKRACEEIQDKLDARCRQ